MYHIKEIFSVCTRASNNIASKTRPTPRAPDPRRASGSWWWESARFQAVCVAVDSAKAVLSRPTHQRVPITCSVKGLKNKRQTILFRECFARPISLFEFAVGFNAISVVETEASCSVQVQASARALLLSMRSSLELCHAQIV